MDTGLLAGSDTDGLSPLHIAYGIRLGIFQRNQRDLHVDQCILRNLPIHRDHIGKEISVYIQLVTPLFERNSVHLLPLYRRWPISFIDLNHIIISALFRLQQGKRLLRIAGRNNSVRDFPFDQPGRILIAYIGQRDKISE